MVHYSNVVSLNEIVDFGVDKLEWIPHTLLDLQATQTSPQEKNATF
jgi:hypothetical protein